jgi:hypothetical protein
VLLERVLEEILLAAATLKIIAATEHLPVIAKILTHLDLSARAPPRSLARAFALFHTA